MSFSLIIPVAAVAIVAIVIIAVMLFSGGSDKKE